MDLVMTRTAIVVLLGVVGLLFSVPVRAQTGTDAGEQTSCAAPIGPTDGSGPVFRNTRLVIADTAGGTEFTFGGCLQNNGPPGSFAGFLVKGLIFDRAGNLLGFATTETAPVPSGNPGAGDAPADQGAPSQSGLQPWAMTSNAGYPISHAQVRPNVLLIVYARACPDGLPAHCAKPYDTGPTYILLTPCVIDSGAVVPATAAACPAAALAASPPVAPAVAPTAAPAAPPAPPPSPPPAPAPAAPPPERQAAKPLEPRPAASPAPVRHPRPRRSVPASPHRNSEP
jgi:hypothetical protein